MENHYCVGIGNRYALFLEEGENSLTAIKKKINKETRKKDKQDKKENADAKKVEPVKTPEKPKKPAESKPATNEVTPKKGMNLFIFFVTIYKYHYFERYYIILNLKFYNHLVSEPTLRCIFRKNYIMCCILHVNVFPFHVE